MPDLGFVTLYVDSPAVSAAFYTDLLGSAPAQQSPTFAMIPLSCGILLGLWSRHTVEPEAVTTGGGTEIAFIVDDLDAVHADWSSRGLVIVQPPTELDFGRTFVALDPDHHRLRVFKPARQ